MENLNFNIEEILNAFDFGGRFKSCRVIGDGHINDTFAFTFDVNGEEKNYLVQELNTNVFRKPVELMNNVVGVTRHLYNKVLSRGGDTGRECLFIINARDGKPFYIDSGNRFWRCFNYVNDAHSVQLVESPDVFKKAGKAFGTFQCLLSDYPIDGLVETIPNFHNTVSRFADFKKAVKDNLSGRAANCADEIDFIMKREKDCGVLVGMLERGELPVRVTHNDTKLNNVMFDNKTGEGICIVDLDTVMPGLSLYDFGDSIRFGASTAAEDEKDLDKVHFSPEYFKAYVEGYLETAGSTLTPGEIDNLAFSSKLMTLECGMRFLGDSLNGDTYFKTDYFDHNLVRCRTQLKLVDEMEKNMDLMNRIVNGTCVTLGLK